MARTYRVRVEVSVEADCEQAFAAWIQPALWNKWFTNDAQIDARPGGRYVNGDGDCGEYLSVERPKRLVFTWDNPQACPGTRVRISFLPLGRRRCRVCLQHSRLPAPETGPDSLEGGWRWALASLKSYLASGKGLSHEAWIAEHYPQRQQA